MSKTRILNPKSILDENDITESINRLNINPIHSKKLWRQITQTDYKNPSELSSFQLPKTFIQELKQNYSITSKVLKMTEASDGSTTKLLIQLQDGLCIESVIMRYGHVELDHYPEPEKQKLKNDDGSLSFHCNKRATLCVSSQVGCAMGCTFCATGTMGLMANLTSGEILEQLYHANKIEKIRGIVFMGMGEPLDNYDSVILSIKAMTDSARFGLRASRISISTVGVVPRILSLINDAPDVGFALSLHAPTQELRCQIVPTAKAWNINRILDATDKFINHQNSFKTNKNRKRHILIEYVMISNVNDSEQVAHQLGQLLKDRKVLLNLIPFNPNLTTISHHYEPPTDEAKSKFLNIVRNIYQVHSLLRQTMGQDVDAACGQLVINSNSNGCNDVQDLEDIGNISKNIKSNNGIGKHLKNKLNKQLTKPFNEKSMDWNGLRKGFILISIVLICLLIFYRNN